MRKAVAIPYIIALIIGVVVVAVLAYWFISSGGKGANVGKEAECTARKVEFCATKSNENLQKAKNCDSEWNPACFCPNIIPGWKDGECPKQEEQQAGKRIGGPQP